MTDNENLPKASQELNLILRVEQDSKDESGEKKDGLKYFEAFISLLKVTLWPLITCILIFSFRDPLYEIIGILPSKISETTKLSVGDISFEVQKQAAIQGYPELAEILGGLSSEALNVLMVSEAGNHSMVSYTINIETSEKETIFLPVQDFMNGLVELEKVGLVEFQVPIEEYNELIDTLNLQQAVSSRTDQKLQYDITGPISEEDDSRLTSQRYWLTKDGEIARDLIIRTISQFLTSTD